MPFYENRDGLRLHYDDRGEGEALVLVHGFGQDGSAWVDVVDDYARFVRVLNVDLRGCGQSGVPEPDYTPRDLANDVVDLLDSLGLEQAHFSGFSLGGAIGMELAIDHPDRVRSLSLHSTWQGGPTPHMERWVDIRSRIIKQGDPVVNHGTRIVSFFSPEWANAHPERIEEFIARAQANPHPISAKGIDGHANACRTHDSRDRLDQITTPTLITCGSMDRSTLPSQSRYIHEHIKGSELVFIDGDGHFTPFSSPGAFLSISLGFLLKHTG